LVAAAAVASAAPRGARADRVAPPRVGFEPVAVAILIEGHVMFMRGSYADADDDGRFAALQLAIDTVAGDAPPDALGALITYGNEARVHRAMGPMATLRGDELGGIGDYDDQIERDLVAGVQAALIELERSHAPHLALVIIGDGADTDPARAAGQLRELRARCDALGIEIYAIVHSLDIGQDLAAIGHIASRIRKAGTVLELVPAVQATFREIGADALAHAHAAARAAAAEPAGASSSGHGLAWWLLGGGIALAVVGGAALLRRRPRVP